MVFCLWELQSCRDAQKRLWSVTAHPVLASLLAGTYSKIRIRDHPACEYRPGTICVGSISSFKSFACSDTNGIRAVQEPQQLHLRETCFSRDRIRACMLIDSRFFSPADIHGIGSFQDGGLQDNLAADIAQRVCCQIWPSCKNPACLLSMGTGVTPRACDRSPHFRHIYQDGFVRRGFDAWMSSMDTEMRWLEMVDQLEDTFKPDYFCFNIPLQNTPGTLIL